MSVAAPIQKLDSIRALRGIAVLLVLFSHLMAVERNFAGDRLLADQWIVGFSGVDLFFVISGFIMVYVTQAYLPSLRTSIHFIFARATRIYPLYWVVSFALFLVWLRFPEIVFSSTNSEPNILRSFLLFPAQQDPLLAIGWTLIHEMYFYLIFGFLLLFPRKYMLWILLGFASFGAVGYVGFGPGFSPVQRIVFSPLTFEFLGGAIVAWAVLRWQFKAWKVWLGIGSFLFITAMAFVWVFADSEFWNNWTRSLIFAPSASLLVFGFVVMEKNGKSFSKFLTWVGDQSYSLYLTHILSLSLFGRIWGWFASPGLLDNLIALPLLVVISLCIGQLTFIWIERPLLKTAYWLRKKAA